MRFITTLLVVFLFNHTYAQQLVYPDNYLIPNNYDFLEYGDPWWGTNEVKTNGNIIVYTWLETGLDTSNYALCYKVTDRWGNIIHDVDSIKAPTDDYVYKAPQLDIFPDDKFIITWIDESDTTLGRDSYFQLFDSNGNKINSEVRVNLDSTNANQYGIPIALNNGNYCIILSDDILNPPSGFADHWIQCYDNQNNPFGYNYIGRIYGSASWSKNVAINDSTIMFVRPFANNVPPYYSISSIRLNHKGEKLDSTWFEWTAFQMDSIYTYWWEVEYFNGSIYVSTRKPTYVSLSTTNTVVAKFSYDNSFVTDTVAPVPSKIVQITPWKVVNDDTLQTNVTSLTPALGIMHDLNEIVVSWPDDRNLGLILYSQYLDTNLVKQGMNFVSAPTTTSQTTLSVLHNELSAAKDFFVQLWEAGASQPFPHGKMWTNIYSLSTSIDEFSSHQNIIIYPNPVSDKIMIKSDLKFSEFSIHDILGKLIASGEISDKVIDISQLQNGIYILNLIEEKRQISSRGKFIKF